MVVIAMTHNLLTALVFSDRPTNNSRSKFEVKYRPTHFNRPIEPIKIYCHVKLQQSQKIHAQKIY